MADKDSRQGLGYADAEVIAWLNACHASHDEALGAAFDAPDKHGMPAIMVGPSEGKLLEMLLRMVGARRVVEVGTLAGFSAIRMARALPDDGRLWTLEYDEKHASVARDNIERAGFSDRIEVLVGDAKELLPTVEWHGPFDAVFIDADKGSYDIYGRWAAKHVRPGGLLLGDNSFFFGNLLDDSDAAAAMRRFHEEAREAFDTVNVPTPDGLLLGIRRG